MCQKLWEKIRKADSIAIAGHVRPDGDCVGSCMALYQYIKKEYPEKNTAVFLENIPERFAYLYQGLDVHTEVNSDQTYQLFLALDCSDQERLGEAQQLLERADTVICIDHHISNEGYGQLNYIAPKASSTAEVLFELLDEEKIDQAIATSLYLGIIHDSGMFRYENTSRRTMEIGGILLEKGVKQSDLADRTVNGKTYVQNQILGRVLLESILLMDKQVVASWVTMRMMEFYGAVTDDLEGIVEQLRLTEGVEVAIVLHEIEPLVYKVSMRSKERVDVSRIACHFGGGGHIRAAGCTMTGTYYDVLNSITEQIDMQL